MNAAPKCAHPACSCVRVDGKKYCSATCADAKGMLELTCQCQHTACQGAQLKALVEGSTRPSYWSAFFRRVLTCLELS